jgi:hypothetical protein
VGINIDKRENLANEIAKIAGVTALVLSLIATISFANTTNSASSKFEEIDKVFQSDTSDSSYWNDSWVPPGYSAWSSDSNIAWKWTEKGEYSCQNYGCLSAEFISERGCANGLYAAINWLDSSESVVSYSNVSIPSLGAYRPAKLKFDDIEGNGKRGEMSTINCR